MYAAIISNGLFLEIAELLFLQKGPSRPSRRVGTIGNILLLVEWKINLRFSHYFSFREIAP